MARTDPERAREISESAESAETPRNRITSLVSLADALPDNERNRKLAWVARASRRVKEANSQYFAAEVAERWYELGEKEQAKALFAESVRQRPDASSIIRGRFAARLAHVDMAEALRVAKNLVDVDPSDAIEVYGDMAFHLAAENPAEAERLLRLIPQVPGRQWLHPAIAWKMAATDPARTRRLVDESQHYDDDPEAYLFLAYGLNARDPGAAIEAFWKAIAGIESRMKEGSNDPAVRRFSWILLPLVEQIDPALVPEIFWRGLAIRPSLMGDLRFSDTWTLSRLSGLLSWYDREVAVALFKPVGALLEQADDSELEELRSVILDWSMIDPRAAVARIERVPLTEQLNRFSDFARLDVGQSLATPTKSLHSEVWHRATTDIRALSGHDIW